MAFERKYSDEVRAQSVARVLERKRAEPRNRSVIREVAEEFEVGEQSLRQWVARYDDGSYDYDGDEGSMVDGAQILASSSASSRSLLKRISVLEAEVERLTEENAVLKKAATLFAADLAARL